ncbi:MAG: hypothetical protein RQM95_02000 [Syntrophaceticus schinkii]
MFSRIFAQLSLFIKKIAIILLAFISRYTVEIPKNIKAGAMLIFMSKAYRMPITKNTALLA